MRDSEVLQAAYPNDFNPWEVVVTLGSSNFRVPLRLNAVVRIFSSDLRCGEVSP